MREVPLIQKSEASLSYLMGLNLKVGRRLDAPKVYLLNFLSVNKTSHSLSHFDADIRESSSLNSLPPAIPNWKTEVLPKSTSKRPQVQLHENGLCEIMHPFVCVW